MLTETDSRIHRNVANITEPFLQRIQDRVAHQHDAISIKRTPVRSPRRIECRSASNP